MKTSIEVEFWVIDREGVLCTPGDLTETSPQVEEEFVDCLFEIKTTPCESVEELRAEFTERVDHALYEANRRDKSLVPLGTPINCGDIEQLPDERSRIQERVLGGDFDYAKHCAGTHMHFEQRSVVQQLNTLIALALLNSSPYFKGHRLGAGARPYIYRKKGYESYPKHGQLWEYVGCTNEWNERLERRYAEFKRAAMDHGVSEPSFDDEFTPDDTIWSPVRLRKTYPTVEWRSPDAALPSQILLLAEEMYDVMDRASHGEVHIEGDLGLVTDDGITLPQFESVREYTDDAIHDGLDSDRVRSYLDRMGFDVSTYDPISPKIDSKQYVSEEEAREIRAEYARELERDVRRLARAEPSV